MAFDWSFNLGHVLTVGSLVIMGTAYVVTNHNDQSNIGENYRRMQVQMDGTATTAAMSSLRSDLTEQIRGVRSDIAALPSVAAELVQIGRRADTLDHRVDILSSRVEENTRNADALKYQTENSKAAFGNIFDRLHVLESKRGAIPP